MTTLSVGPAGLGIELGDESTTVDGWSVRELLARPGLDGPDGVLQGGFAVGLAEAVARTVDRLGAPLTGIEARLHAPTPLGRTLTAKVRPAEGVARYEVRTYDGGRLLVAATVELGGPEAAAAPADLLELGRVPIPAAEPQHAFPHCFVCGSEPRHDLALLLHPRLVDATSVSMPIVFDRGLGDDRGRVDPTVVAAVLDCPGVWASYDYVRSVGHRGALLGGYRVTHFRDTPVDEPLRVVGRMDEGDGRKIRARCAVVDEEGACYAMSSALHVAVARIPGEGRDPS